MAGPEKIAFIKQGNFSHTNDRVRELLGREFSECELLVIDLWKDLLNLRRVDLVAAACLLYGRKLLLQRHPLRNAMLRTPRFFHLAGDRIRARLGQEKHLRFTFQTQSLFNARTGSVPNFVYTDHTHLSNLEYPGFSSTDLYAKSWIDLERSIYRDAERVFTMSTNVRRTLVEQYGVEASRAVCAGGGFNAPATAGVAADDARYGQKRILFVGIDWERKGGPSLVKAFRKVLVTHPDATLQIVGCSPSVDVPRCEVVGKVPLDEVPAFYRQASVFCLPSRIEPFGIVFLEAMSYGLPVIGTSIGGIPDFIREGENGHLVPPDDPDALAAVLSRLLSNPGACQSLGAAGSRIAREEFTWEITGRRIRDEIERALSPTPATNFSSPS